VLRSGFRTGDNAPMAVLEFVDRCVVPSWSVGGSCFCVAS